MHKIEKKYILTLNCLLEKYNFTLNNICGKEMIPGQIQVMKRFVIPTINLVTSEHFGIFKLFFIFNFKLKRCILNKENE